MTGDYVWDRTGFPDPEIVRLERLLKPLQYQPAPLAAHEAMPGMARSRSRSSIVVLIATAAAIVALVIASGRETSLAVTRLAGAPTIGSRPMAEQGQLSPAAGSRPATTDARTSTSPTPGASKCAAHAARIAEHTSRLSPASRARHDRGGDFGPAGQFSVSAIVDRCRSRMHLR